MSTIVANRKRVTKPSPLSSADHDQGREEIIRAAARAFMTAGFAGSSLDTVADELGCTKGRIYYRYRSKHDLFLDVQKEAMRMNFSVIEPHAQSSASAGDRLRAMVVDQILLIMSELPFQRVMVQGVEMHLEGSTTPVQREMLETLIRWRDEYENTFVKVVEDGVRTGEFRKVNPKVFVKVLLGSLCWMTFWYRTKSDETQAKRRKFALELADCMLHGIFVNE